MKQLYAISSFLCLAALLAASCTTSLTDEPDTTARAIAFSTPQAGTRAAVTSSTDMCDFSVWGGYDSSVDNVFNNETVQAQTWTYDGGTRYWIPGKTYNFYAVHPATLPAGTTADVSSDGTITVTDFDCSATGDAAFDLMTATAPGLLGSNASTVGLEFEHLLAKIEFVGKSEGGNATVNKLVLGSISTQGTYVSSATPLWSNLTNKDIIIDSSTDLTPDGVSVSGDMLLIPQTLTAPQLTVTYNTDTETGRTETYTLPVDVVSSWVAGQSYRYTFTVTGGGYIIFDTPTVNKWGSATGGNITIDVTEPNS